MTKYLEFQKPYTKQGKENWEAVFGHKCSNGCGTMVKVKGDTCCRCLTEIYESMASPVLPEIIK
jgi:hypothetical protein